MDGKTGFAMDDMNALVIECDEMHQTEDAMKSIEKGLPIHLEKPGSEDSTSFRKLVDMAEAKNLVFPEDICIASTWDSESSGCM